MKPRTSDLNHRIVLAERPHGAPTEACFRREETPIPRPQEGELLLRTLWLSLDPYMRGRMSDRASYAAPTPLGATMGGGTVALVVESHAEGFHAGDIVLSMNGWQEYAVERAAHVTRLPADLARPSTALGVLGMPGFTATMGLLDIGAPKPGETVVVAAATGAVGSLVGQIAKIHGARAVGIAGGAEKCRYAVEELGFDACLDHRDDALPELLKGACPDGIDVYFESVGGKVFDAVLPLLNTKARIPVCGLIAGYNATDLPAGPDRTPLLMSAILSKRLTVRGFIISQDYGPRFGEFQQLMTGWLAGGRIKYREDVVEGLENAPRAFIGLLEGRNFGKLVVRVSGP